MIFIEINHYTISRPYLNHFFFKIHFISILCLQKNHCLVFKYNSIYLKLTYGAFVGYFANWITFKKQKRAVKSNLKNLKRKLKMLLNYLKFVINIFNKLKYLRSGKQKQNVPIIKKTNRSLNGII